MTKEKDREYTDDELRAAQAVLNEAQSALFGQGRVTQAIVIAALTTQWIHGHKREAYEEVLLQHIRAVRYFMEHAEYRDTN